MKPLALSRVLFFVCVLCAASLLLFAGDVNGQTQSVVSTNQLTADEDFALNIGERRSTEQLYKRSTRVEINGNNLTIGAGAEVSAQRIDILLRGVTGRIRFRASLEALHRRIEQVRRQAPSDIR